MGLFEKMMGYANEFKQGAQVSDAESTDAAKQSPRERDLLQELSDKADTGGSKVRYALLFSGTVQGVGFRWTNQSLAREHRLSGWVRNLDDGTVEAEIQGTPTAIGAHLGRLHAYYSRFRNTIWLERATKLPVIESETDFDVRA